MKKIPIHQKNCKCASCKSKRGEYNGKNNPNYRGGKNCINPKKICIDCSKQLATSRAKRCKSCFNLYIWATTDKRKKVSEKLKGIPLKEETKIKMRENSYDRNGKNNPMYGVHRFGKDSPAWGLRGENAGNWKGGITPLHISIRNLNENKIWNIENFKKYNYTCQECGKRGGDIQVHHIKRFSNIFKEFLKEYDQFSPIEDKETLVRLAFKYEPFWNLDNGIILCKKCHKELHKNVK